MQALDHGRTPDRVERFENGTELACRRAVLPVLRSIQVAASGIDIGLLDLVFPRDRAKVPGLISAPRRRVPDRP